MSNKISTLCKEYFSVNTAVTLYCEAVRHAVIETCSSGYAGECILDCAKRSDSSIRRRTLGEFSYRDVFCVVHLLVLVRILSSVIFVSSFHISLTLL